MDELMQESDSDDDLVAPDFLSKAGTKIFKVLTPRKAIRPSRDTLSPLPTLGDKDYNERRSKASISLLSLLTEKKKDDVVQQNVNNIMELKEKYENEDYMEWVNNDNDEVINCSQISNSQDFDDSQDPSQHRNNSEQGQENSEQGSQNINKENFFPHSKHLVNDFPDTYPGEKYFIRYRHADDLTETVKELYCYVMECQASDLDKDFDMADSNFLYTILQSYIPLKQNLPDNICKCLWHILNCSQDYKLSHNALQILTNYMLDKNLRPGWLPQVDDLMESLERCGADINLVLPLSIAELIGKHIQSVEAEAEESPVSPKSIRKCFNSRLHNFCGIIKLMTISIQCHSKRYSLVEVDCILVITLRLSIEKVIQSIVCDLRVLIGSLLDVYEDDAWENTMEKLWKLISAFNMHHRNLLKLVETIPPSLRGTEFRQMLAFNCASSIIQKTSLVFHRLPIRVVDIFNLISSIKITEDTIYFELYSAFTLIFMCINTDDLTAAQKSNFSKLKDKLHMIHGDIKECQGAYLDRTKVKDVLLRMVSKLKFVVQNLQCQSKLESYFGSSSQNIKMLNNSEESGDGVQYSQ